MITLHHLENSRSIRILWLLEELGLTYNLERYNRDRESDLVKDDFKKLHSLGKAPILTDGNLVLIESAAIIEYLIDTYANGRLKPHVATPERIKYNYWMHAAEGSAMNLATVALVLNRMDARTPFLFRPIIKMVTKKVREGYITPSMDNFMAYIEAQLSSSLWFAGREFSGADVQMGFVMSALQARGGLNDKYPSAMRWLGQMNDRPAYQAAMEKNGDFNLVSP